MPSSNKKFALANFIHSLFDKNQLQLSIRCTTYLGEIFPKSLDMQLGLYLLLFLSHGELLRQSLKEYPNAVCNDGTSAVYYYEPGTNNDLWVVDLQGGGWCYDDKSCTNRCDKIGTTLCGSSKLRNGEFPDSLKQAGILDSSNSQNPAKEAHKVFVLYCSSDGWMGRSDNGPLGHKYKGSYIVEAVFQDLVAKHDLGSKNTQTVIFGGQSAGGRGAMFNIDHIFEWAAVNTLNIELRGWLDSPYWLPIEPMYGQTSLLEQTRLIHEYAKNEGVIRKKCAQAYQNSTHFCMFGYYTMPFVETPSVMESATFDTFQLGTNIGHNPTTPEEMTYVYNFAIALGRNMKLLATQNSNLILFAPACCNHAVSLGNDFTTMVSDSVTEAMRLKMLLETPPPYAATSAVLDQCAENRQQACCGKQQNQQFYCP